MAVIVNTKKENGVAICCPIPMVKEEKMAETLYIASTRKSPLSLADIGYKDGDMTTLKALAGDIASTKGLIDSEYIPISWIKQYVEDWVPDAKGIFDYMFDEYKKEVTK